MEDRGDAGSMSAGTGKPFYGWISFSGAALAGLIGTGIFIYAYGVFLPVMSGDFGWSRAAIAMGMTLGYIFYGLCSPLVGFCVAKFGPRINILSGSLLLLLCLVGMSRVTELWHVFLLYSLAGVASNFIGFITTNAVASNWFRRKRSLAMGIISASIGVGGFIVPIVAASSISSFGWRVSWLVLAGMVVIAFISGFFVRNRPEDMGQVPDGVPAEPGQAAVRDLEENREAKLWTVKKVLQQPSTWLIMVFMTSNFFAWATMMAHQEAYVEGLGSASMIAALTVSVLAGASIIGGVAYGVMAFRFSIRRLATVSFAIYTLSTAILLITNSLPFIYVYAFLFGLSGGAILPVMSSLLAGYYGRSVFPKVLGIMNLLIFPFQALAPAIAGAIYDTTGAYTMVFVILTAFSFVGFICTFLVRPPRLVEPEGRPVASSI